MWGMSNEINGVQVSKIGIYMCIDDPLNIYKNTQEVNSNDILLTDDKLNIQNFNSTVQNMLNFSNISLYNTTTNSLPITTTITSLPITTTTSLPTTTTTSLPTTTTTTSLPTTTTTTSLPTTTTTTSLPTTTTTLSPTTTLSHYTTIKSSNKSSSRNNSIHYDYIVNENYNKEKNDNENNNENTLLILLIITSSTTLFCCCCASYHFRKNIFRYCSNLCQTLKTSNKISDKIDESDVPKLQKPPKKRNIQSKQQVTPKAPIPKLESLAKETTIDIPRPLTPVNNQRLKFSNDILNVTTPKTNEWYKNTFENEINLVQDAIHNPRAPRTNSPKPFPAPKENHKKSNKKIHTKINNTIPLNMNNKPSRKLPLKKHEFRNYSNSWADRTK